MAGLAIAGSSRRNTVPPILNQPDADLIALASQLSLEDIEQIERDQQRSIRGGHRTSDAELALSLFAQEARNSIIFNNDRALARALHEGERHNAVGALRAVRLAQPAVAAAVLPPVPPVPRPPLQRASSSESSFFSQFFGWISSFVSSPDQPSSSRLLPTRHICVICQDQILGAEVYTPCRHYYDQGCITDLFRSAITDESLFPPRCCRQIITLSSVRSLLTADLVAQFEEKQREYSTPKRVYCANPRCSRFLGPVTEGWSRNVYLCPAPDCDTRTCSACKRNIATSTTSNYLFYVPSHTCQPDPEDERVLALGRASQWAQCPSCDQMIELAFGCFHMTCLCKTEFCYICRARWKTCSCPQWDENRLVNAAEARADAQIAGRPGGRVLRPPPRHPILVQQPPRPAAPVRPIIRLPETASVQSRPRPVVLVQSPPSPASPPRAVPPPLPSEQAPSGSTRTFGFEHREPASQLYAYTPYIYYNATQRSTDETSQNKASGGNFASAVARAAAARRTSIARTNTTLAQAGPSSPRKPNPETNALVRELSNEDAAKNRTLVEVEQWRQSFPLPNGVSNEGKGKSRDEGVNNRTQGLNSFISSSNLKLHNGKSQENQGKNLTESQVESWRSLLPPPKRTLNEKRVKSRENNDKNRADDIGSWRPLSICSLNDNKGNSSQNKGKNRAIETEMVFGNFSDLLPALSSSSSVSKPASSLSSSTLPNRANNQNQKRLQALNNTLRQIHELRTELGVSAARSPLDVSKFSQGSEEYEGPSRHTAAKDIIHTTPLDVTKFVQGPEDQEEYEVPSRRTAAEDTIHITHQPGQQLKRPQGTSATIHRKSSHTPIVRLPPKRSQTVAGAVPTGSLSDKARGKRPAYKPSVPAMQPSSSMTPGGSNSVIKGGNQQMQRPKQSKHGESGDELKDQKGAPRSPPNDVLQHAQTRAQLVREYIASIRTNEDCSHERWKTERPGGRCDMCHRDLRLFIFICAECQTSACNRCRRNRL